MPYLLDTDVISELARAVNKKLAQAVGRCNMTELAISPITVGEVRFGQAAKALPERLASRLEDLFLAIRCPPLDHGVALHYAQLRAHLQRCGTPIGPNDNWIAAHALAGDFTLVTGNEREFDRVPGLRVENWLR
jgi:tRNA(fMet)-specific endonuclease VapC